FFCNLYRVSRHRLIRLNGYRITIAAAVERSGYHKTDTLTDGDLPGRRLIHFSRYRHPERSDDCGSIISCDEAGAFQSHFDDGLQRAVKYRLSGVIAEVGDHHSHGCMWRRRRFLQEPAS